MFQVFTQHRRMLSSGMVQTLLISIYSPAMQTNFFFGLKKKKKERKWGITFSSTPRMTRRWCCCYVIIELSVDLLVVKNHGGRREKLLGWFIVCGDGSHYQLYDMSPSFHKKEKVWGRDGEDMKRGGKKMTGTGWGLNTVLTDTLSLPSG